MSLPVPCKNLMKKEEEFKTAPSVLKVENHEGIKSDSMLSKNDLMDKPEAMPGLTNDLNEQQQENNFEREGLDESHLSSLFTNDNNNEIGETNMQYLNFTSGGKSNSYRQSYREDEKTHEIYLLAKDNTHHGDFKT